MRSHCVCLALVVGLALPQFFAGPTPCFTQTTFQRRYGGTSDDAARSVQQTSDGGYIIAGYTGSFGAGQDDVYLIKTDSSGDTLWTRTYGGASDYDLASSVQQTFDGGYIIAGGTASFGAGLEDVYVVKTNSLGDTLWTRTYGCALYDAGFSVQQTSDGGYIIAGDDSGGVGFGRVYLLKTSSTGKTLWTRNYGHRGYINGGYSVRQTYDGGYIIAGRDLGVMYYTPGALYLVKTDKVGDTLWTRTYCDPSSGNSVRQTSDGGYIIAGLNPFGQRSYLGRMGLFKTNSSGDTVWTRTYGDSSSGYSVQQTSDGGYIIAGSVGSYGSNGCDVYLVKTQADGLVSVQADHGTVSTEFILQQNYPNPFNPSTTINYSVPLGRDLVRGADGQLPTQSYVTLKVYDVLGREVATLVDGIETVGYKSVQLDAPALASGVYLYQLRVGAVVTSKRCLLLR